MGGRVKRESVASMLGITRKGEPVLKAFRVAIDPVFEKFVDRGVDPDSMRGIITSYVRLLAAEAQMDKDLTQDLTPLRRLRLRRNLHAFRAGGAR
jgi:hypothetical protein